jgi:predicted  nucleic acid-binding Zn-ribbon protein
MSAEVERKLRELAPRMQRLDELRAERDRQRLEVSAAEELLKQLKWASYQAEQAYVQMEEAGSGLGGMFSRMFTDHQARCDELLHAAQDAREAYEAARDKLKPLRDELTHLEQEVADLEAARPEYDALLEARARSMAAAGGPAQHHLAQLQEEARRIVCLLERSERLRKQAQKLESLMLRCDRSNLFTIRGEFTPFQKEFSVFILEAQAAPPEWRLPSLPDEADVRMLDPVGTNSKMHFPDNTEERVMELAVGMQAFSLNQEAARMRAVVNAGLASDEAIRQQARYQSALCADWGKKLGAFASGLRRLKTEAQQKLEAILFGVGAAVAARPPEAQ